MVVRPTHPSRRDTAQGIVGMWEREDAGRIGLELFFTGVQRLEADPYAERSEPYVVVGVLAERQFGVLACS